MAHQTIYQRGGMKEHTAFVTVELNNDLLHCVEQEAKVKGVTTTALLNDILTTALVVRYPHQ